MAHIDQLIMGAYWGCCDEGTTHEKCYRWRWLDIGGAGPVMPKEAGTVLTELPTRERRWVIMDPVTLEQINDMAPGP